MRYQDTLNGHSFSALAKTPRVYAAPNILFLYAPVSDLRRGLCRGHRPDRRR
jgi:hypothetical protein